MIERILIKKILTQLDKGKVVILLGPRQVGKTTLAHAVAEKAGVSLLWLNGDEPDVRNMLTDVTSTRLKSILGKHRFIVIDEAQRVSNIGVTLKLITDNIPGKKILVTGSSALELASNINEPLTGRKFENRLYPLSFAEMAAGTSLQEEHRLLEHRMIYGYYPEVINNPGEEVERLREIVNSYLFKDILSIGLMRKPVLVEKLVQALAFQVGSEVSWHELGQIIGANNETVERYVNLLEKTFVVFTLTSLSRNLRGELKKSRKIYFYDNGIRNGIIANFNSLALRQDTGALWENFLMSERLKWLEYSGAHVNRYFWRTQLQQEIDYVEERNGQLHAYEFKWKPKASLKFPKAFIAAYPRSKMEIIDRENYKEFVGGAQKPKLVAKHVKYRKRVK